MIRDEPTGNSEIDPRVNSAGTTAMAVLLFAVAMLLGATIYAVGQSADRFRWETFRSGAFVFLILLAGTAVAGLAMTLLLKAMYTISPMSMRMASERRRLNKARRRAMKTIHRRHELQEEQARITAMLQASYLYEKESARIGNSQALKEFRKALQTGVVNSCEIVFEHLNRTVEQYEQVVDEIEKSSLESSEKTELLDQLNRQLNVAGLDQRHRTTQRMMEDAIWRVRLQKARKMARRDSAAAIKYLNSVRGPDTSHRILIQINALLKDLQSPE